jgi:hypothetical protein
LSVKNQPLSHDTIVLYVMSLQDTHIIFFDEIIERNIMSGDWEEMDRLKEVLTEIRKKRCI